MYIYEKKNNEIYIHELLPNEKKIKELKKTELNNNKLSNYYATAANEKFKLLEQDTPFLSYNKLNNVAGRKHYFEKNNHFLNNFDEKLQNYYDGNYNNLIFMAIPTYNYSLLSYFITTKNYKLSNNLFIMTDILEIPEILFKLHLLEKKTLNDIKQYDSILKEFNQQLILNDVIGLFYLSENKRIISLNWLEDALNYQLISSNLLNDIEQNLETSQKILKLMK